MDYIHRHKYLKLILAAGGWAMAVAMSGCADGQDNGLEPYAERSGEEYARAELFCDVNFWEPPYWQTEPGTVTGDISKATGLALDITVPLQDADTQLVLRMLNDDPPDIISITDETATSQLVSSGKVWDLEEFFSLYKPDSHLLSRFPEDIKKELTKRDGGWYALPSHMNSMDARTIWEPSTQYYKDVIKYNHNYAIIWNRKLLDLAGLTADDIRTESQVLSALEKVKDMGLTVDRKDVIPLLLDGRDYQESSLRYLENTFGAEWVDEDGNYMDALLQPEARDVLSFLNTVIRKNYADPEHLTKDNPWIKAAMASGRVLCFIGNVANTGVDPSQWISSGPILASSGKRPVLGKNLRATKGWLGTFVSRDCKNPEQVAAWLDYMTSDEGMLLWNFGYEGIHYTRDERGLITRTDTGEKDALDYSRTGIKAWWMFVNTTWEQSVSADPGPGQVTIHELDTAFGRWPDTYIYDEALLAMPAEYITKDSTYGDMETEAGAWKKSQIPAVIMAENDSEFETRYQQLTDGLYGLGIVQLDEYRNRKYRENCQEYGNSIRKVNHSTGGDTDE